MELSRVIDGRFRITGQLGSGGMGEVYRARDERLHRDVALKLLPQALSHDADRLSRFEREARAAAALNHPNILALYDLGYSEGAPYLVSELLEGESLRERIVRGPLEVKDAVELGVQLARGLAAAHRKGIVHRDLKPENAFITTDGTPKILDFGLARLQATLDEALPVEEAPTELLLTQVGTVLGTEGYMAPEQVRGQHVDQRADIFAFGCVLYEMLTGKRAFARDTMADTMSAILKEEPAPLAEGPTDVPSAVVQLVGRCLEKSPEDRFSSAQDLLQALQAAGSDADVLPARATAAPRRLRPRRLPGRPLALGLAAALIVIVGVLLIWLLSGRSDRTVQTALEPARVLVAEFDNRTGDSSLDSIAALTVDAITQGLVELGEIEVVPAPADSPTENERVLRAAARDAGAGIVVSGSYYLTGDTLDLRTRVIDTASGQPLYALKPETGQRRQPDEVIEHVRQRVMGAIVLHQGRSPFLGALTTPPLHPAYLECMAGLHASATDWRLAITHFERAAELDPEFWFPQILLLRGYTRFRDETKLEALRQRLLENEDKFGPADRIAKQFTEARLERRFREALRKAREMLKMAPRDLGWRYSAATFALGLNRPREALEYLGDREDIDWVTMSAWIQGSWMISHAAFAHHLLGEHEAELEVVELGLDLYPDSLLLPQDQVRALAALGRVEEIDAVMAESLTIRAQRHLPGEVLLTAAQELRVHGRTDLARRVGTRCAEWYGSRTGEEASYVSTPLNQFECLWLAERFDEAQKVIEQTFAAHSEEPYVQGYRGIAAARAGERQIAEAMEAQLAAMDDQRRAAGAFYMRACIAAQLGDRQRSVALLNEAIALHFPFKGYLHVRAFLEPLTGYPPFEELLAPKG